jgi:uncharacterized membrane protein HdeD (DUF308 family)
MFRGENEPMSAVLAQNWWAVALRGVVALLFGLATLLTPGMTLLALLALFAFYMIFDGIFDLVAAVRAARQHNERWPLLILEAVVDFAVAGVTLFWPGVTLLGFVMLFAVWALVTGGLAVGAAFRLRRDHGRWWMAIGGVLSILLGILFAITPLTGALVFAWWIGAYAVLFGISMLALAFRLYAHRTDHLHGAPMAHA